MMENSERTRQKTGGSPRPDRSVHASETSAATALERERYEHAATRRNLARAQEELRLATRERDEIKARAAEGVEGGDPLATTAALRCEVVLRGSNVAVFTQDAALRYDFVSKPLFGRAVQEIQGRDDEDLLGAEVARELAALKREVLETGRAVNAELHVADGDGGHWYDFHLEALRDSSGALAGLIGTALDITERKDNETHLRLLLRELTHRSKNLLAVIQAMARQTARHSGNIGTFLDRFSARVQALARSHDLLVAASWHSVLLGDLVRSQLGLYLERAPGAVKIEGPDIELRPEAAQSLGLALHELAINAHKHGALSRARGQVSVVWRRNSDGALELVWRETGGPKVAEPKRRGFGSMAIEHNLARVLHGEVTLSFDPDGLVCRIVVPANQIASRA